MILTQENLLTALPQTLREELFSEFNKILQNYRESRWEPAELNGGKLSEIVYSILNGFVSGEFPSKATKPRNFYDACKTLEAADPEKFNRSVRVQMPRILISLYEIRNNRGVGHVGGDVNPNHMDSTYVVYAAKWLIAELIRIFHHVDIKTASDAIETIICRESALVWNIGDKKRVLVDKFTFKEQTLLLLHSCSQGSAAVNDLFTWVEYSSFPKFKSNILQSLHKDRLIEYDQNLDFAKISPKGISFVETELINKT